MNDLPIVIASVDPTGTWFTWLLNQGVLGFVVAVLLFFLIRKDTALEESHKERLNDLKEMKTMIKEQTVALKASTIAENERNRALEASSRVAEKIPVILDRMTKDLEDLRKTK